MAESAEGARLLSEYMLKKRIEGSNPSLSAIRRAPRISGACSWQATTERRGEWRPEHVEGRHYR